MAKGVHISRESGYTEAEVQALLKNIKSQIVDSIYPVGAIYMSTTDTSPVDLFGGEWEQIENRFLLAAGSSYTAGDTGGAATVTLSTANLPAHTHGEKSLSGSFLVRPLSNRGANVAVGSSGIVDVGTGTGSWGGGMNYSSLSPTDSGHQVTINATHTHSSVGSGTAHGNMPPYLVVYIWKRTG